MTQLAEPQRPKTFAERVTTSGVQHHTTHLVAGGAANSPAVNDTDTASAALIAQMFPNARAPSLSEGVRLNRIVGSLFERIDDVFPGYPVPPRPHIFVYDGKDELNATTDTTLIPHVFSHSDIYLDKRLLERCDNAELSALIGHELGHVIMNNNGNVIGNYALLTEKRILQDKASLGVVTSAQNDQYNEELRADLISMRLNGSADGFIGLMGILAGDNPDPCLKALYQDHPSAELRIEAAQNYTKHMDKPAPPPSFLEQLLNETGKLFGISR